MISQSGDPSFISHNGWVLRSKRTGSLYAITLLHPFSVVALLSTTNISLFAQNMSPATMKQVFTNKDKTKSTTPSSA